MKRGQYLDTIRDAGSHKLENTDASQGPVPCTAHFQVFLDLLGSLNASYLHAPFSWLLHSLMFYDSVAYFPNLFHMLTSGLICKNLIQYKHLMLCNFLHFFRGPSFPFSVGCGSCSCWDHWRHLTKMRCFTTSLLSDQNIFENTGNCNNCTKWLLLYQASRHTMFCNYCMPLVLTDKQASRLESRVNINFLSVKAQE